MGWILARQSTLNLINMSHDNIESAFEFARDATAIRKPADMVNLWTTYTYKQLELFSAQSKQLTELGQKFVTKSPLRSRPKVKFSAGLFRKPAAIGQLFAARSFEPKRSGVLSTPTKGHWRP